MRYPQKQTSDTVPENAANVALVWEMPSVGLSKGWSVDAVTVFSTTQSSHTPCVAILQECWVQTSISREEYAASLHSPISTISQRKACRERLLDTRMLSRVDLHDSSKSALKVKPVTLQHSQADSCTENDRLLDHHVTFQLKSK